MTEPTVLSPSHSTATPPLPRWIPVGMVVLTMLSAASAWLAWQTHSRAHALEQELVRRQQDSQTEVLEARVAAKQAQELARDAAARAALQDARLAEVALQRTQVEDLIRSVNLSRDESVVAEIEATLRVAGQQTTLTGSAEPMILALQSAQDRLERVKLPGLENVRRAVDKDLERLRSTRVADLATLSARLDEAMRMVDELVLLNQPRSSVRAGKATHQATANTSTLAPQATSEAEGWSSQAWQTSTQWLSRWAQAVWMETRSLIRLSRIEHPESMLIAPEEGFFLRENAKLRLLNARLALLSRQTPTALNDLRQVKAVLPRYFDMATPKSQRLMQMLDNVSEQSMQTSVPRPDETLAALAAVSGLR